MDDFNRPMRVFAAFSGGGAKGVVHVGAKLALEQVSERSAPFFNVAGYAGTSAGAIVAALSAVGYTSRDMIDVERGRTIVDIAEELRANGKTGSSRRTWRTFVQSMFGDRGWVSIDTIRTIFGSPIKWPLLALMALSLLSPVFVAVWWFFSRARGPISTELFASGFILFFAYLVLVLLFALAVRGIVSLARFHGALGVVLNHKLDRPIDGHPATFADLEAAKGVSLKIVASNVSERSLKLFSASTTPDVAIADAVVASACFPILFRPRTIDGAVYVDGGLVSNLPAWAFDDERALDNDAVVIAFDVVDREVVGSRSIARPTGLRFLHQLTRTAIFGSGMLNTRAVVGIENVRLPTEATLLDFDMGMPRAEREIGQAYQVAVNQLERRFELEPYFYGQAASQLLSYASERFPDRIMRVAVARPDAGDTRSIDPNSEFARRATSIRYVHHAGFEETPAANGWPAVLYRDKGIVLPINGSIVGTAFKTNEIRFESKPFSDDFGLSDPALTSVRARIWPGLSWILCVPVHLRCEGEKRVAFVVVLDGEKTPEIDDESVAEAFADVASYARALFADVLHDLQVTEGSKGP